MHLSSTSFGLATIFASVLFVENGAARAEDRTVAFYYGFDLPAELEQAYDRIVVQPGHVAPDKAAHAGLIAYVSLGEVGGTDREQVRSQWILGENPAWDSAVVDIRKEAFQRHFVEQRVAPLMEQGFKGVFLDTLDSPLLYLKSDVERASYRKALVNVLRLLRARFPDREIYVNRGFEALEDFAGYVDAVVAESLFATWDPESGRYRQTTFEQRRWLLGQLKKAHDHLRLPVIVIDYVDPARPSEARRVARKIAAEGFTPWVADGHLTTSGVGAVQFIPRRIMVVRDGRSDYSTGDHAFRYLAGIIEHLGFVPEFASFSDGVEDPTALDGKYQGLVVWASGAEPIPSTVGALIKHCRRLGKPVLILGDVPQVLSRVDEDIFGIKSKGTRLTTPIRAISESPHVGFEVAPAVPVVGAAGLAGERAQDTWIALAGSAGERAEVAAITSWGGYALSSYFLRHVGLGEFRWVLDPFRFVAAALQLPEIPVPDVTTEDGKRLLVAEIGAQGLTDTSQLPGRPPVHRVLHRTLAKYGVRHELALDAEEERPRIPKHSASLFYPPEVSPLSQGTTDATKSSSSLTHVSPAGRIHESGVEVFAPIASDDAYGVEGSPYAFRRVVETYEFTSQPRRLSAVGLSFDASVAASARGVAALSSVYEWLEANDLVPLRSSSYAQYVRDFYELRITQSLDGTYIIRGAEALRTYRLPREASGIVTEQSSQTTTIASGPEGHYVSFRRASPVELTLHDESKETRAAPSQPAPRANRVISFVSEPSL